jgi:hypothetical protein
MKDMNAEAGSRPDQHFSEEDWVDFARAQGNLEQRARVVRHLEAGCPRCAQTLRIWAAVLSVAEQKASCPPPEQTIANLKKQFARQKPKGLRERLASEVALVFDSFRQPLPAGVRASGLLPPRYLLYKAGRYAIRVRVEPTAASNNCTIVGQILDEQEPTRALRDIAVLAMKGTRTLGRTLTNQLGEFQLEPDAAGSLQLSVGVPEIGTFTVEPPRWTEKPARQTRRRATGKPAQGGKARPR